MNSLVLKRVYPQGYPSDAVEVLKTMSFTDGRKVNIVGSMSLRSQVYAGDYDANERVIVNEPRVDALKLLVGKFKSIIKNLKRMRLTYVSDIKSGSVEEWRIINRPYNFHESRKQLERLHDSKIIDHKTYLDGKKKIKRNPTDLELLLLEQDFRPNIIRWSVSEVMLGYKKLVDGRRFTLEEAFMTPTITKLDVVSWVQNNRFTDFSMIYEFVNNGIVLNPSIRDFEESVLENIYVLHSQKQYYKMAKRIFALAKFNRNTETLKILSPLFNGDLGRLYIVYGDIGTIETMFETERFLPYSKMEFEFDQFKGRLSNISLQRYIDQEDEIFNDIDELVKMNKIALNRQKILSILNSIKKRLLELLSHYSKEYLQKHKLLPDYR
jgi:hypothetical protein